MGIVSFVKDVGNGAVHIAESGYKAAKEGVSDIAGTSEDILHETGEFLKNPAEYVEKQFSNLSVGNITHAVSFGLDNVVEGMAKEAGLAPLINGVNAFVDEVSDVVAKILQMAKCLAWVENPTYWAVTAGIYAARVQGLIKSRGDCERFVTGGEFLKAVGAANVPLLDLLPCAIEAAFLAPLPAPGSKTGASALNVGQRAAKNLSSSALGKAAEIMGGQSLASIRNAVRPSAVGAVSRSADKLDIMIVRTDGSTVTAA